MTRETAADGDPLQSGGQQAQGEDHTAPSVLVLDDDPAVTRMLSLSLMTDGFDVSTAGDGIEGLERLERQSFDIIVLDLQMPRMDGRTFFREMRSRGYQTPVVILSAYGADVARLELRANGAVSKPFDPDDLAAVVRRIIGT
jgi:DNA-binding response OmpR family regulator